MSDYFQEMGWQPLSEGQAPDHLLHLARLFRDFNIFDESLSQILAPPASKTVVENLPNVAIQEETKCPVCLKKHELDEIVKKMPCNHTFHSDCILPWLAKTNSCPVCRFELPTDNEDYEAYRKEKIRAKKREADIEILHNSMFS